MVQALSSNRANEPLCVSVLPRACWCRQYFLNAQGLQPFANSGAINAIAITNQIFRRISVGTSFNDLLCNPFCRRMVCRVEVQDLTPAMGDHYEDEQHFERDRRDSKEIHRDDMPNMIAEECLPALGRASGKGAQNTRD